MAFDVDFPDVKTKYRLEIRSGALQHNRGQTTFPEGNRGPSRSFTVPPYALRRSDRVEDLLLRIADGERSRLPARRKLLECLQEFANIGRDWRKNEDAVQNPIVVSVRRDLPTLLGVAPQVQQRRKTQDGPGFRPGLHGLREAMLHKDDLPVVVA